jgi:hypothetical protein
MGLGNSPADKHWRSDDLKAIADADRAARLAGRKSPFRRVLERLRPRRQEPVGDPPGNYSTTNDPGR